MVVVYSHALECRGKSKYHLNRKLQENLASEAKFDFFMTLTHEKLFVGRDECEWGKMRQRYHLGGDSDRSHAARIMREAQGSRRRSQTHKLGARLLRAWTCWIKICLFLSVRRLWGRCNGVERTLQIRTPWVLVPLTLHPTDIREIAPFL
jgi:hypothetical protein